MSNVFFPCNIAWTMNHGEVFCFCFFFFRRVAATLFKKMTVEKRNIDWLNTVLLQWIYYEAGFLICATIGIIFVVLTPIIGMCFCVCRCCENCGGEMHQRQRKNVDCQRGFYTASLIATSIFIMWVIRVILLIIFMRFIFFFLWEKLSPCES